MKVERQALVLGGAHIAPSTQSWTRNDSAVAANGLGVEVNVSTPALPWGV